MKQQRFSEEKITYALAQESTGETITEICRRLGVSQQTFYRWKKKFGAMGLTEIRRLKQLEEENSKLKRLVADLSLDKAILQDVLRKNGEGLPSKRAGRARAGGIRDFAAVSVLDAAL
jgi:putative transposase